MPDLTVANLQTLHRVGVSIAAELDQEKVLTRTVDAAVFMSQADEGAISLLDKDTNALYVRASKGPRDEHARSIRVRGSDSVSSIVFRTNEIQRMNESDVKIATGYLAKAMLVVPLTSRGRTLGVLTLINWTAGHLFSEEDQYLISTLANYAAIAVENARLFGVAETMALTDGLTGLANRRAFDYVLEKEVARAHRYAHPLSLAILDVDDFKTYNDTHGHIAGDEQLKAQADLISRSMREADLVARYGGDEFAIIIPNTGQLGAIRLGERIRRDAEAAAPGPNGGSPIPGFSISMGVASYDNGMDNPLDLLRAADKAVLAAKLAGKNRVCTWPPN